MNKEAKKKYRIPERKVLPDLLAEQDPSWAKELKNKKIWQRDNLHRMNASELSEPAKSQITVYQKLNEILLEIGGSETCFAHWDDDFIPLLERGYYRDGKSKKVKGKPCGCHYNAARIYDERVEEDDVIICTGMALSNDGMWRQHSWLIQKYESPSGKAKTRILETTEKRVAYFGFELTDKEANEFAELNHR